MKTEKVTIGLDIGTSACKAVVVDTQAACVLESIRMEYAGWDDMLGSGVRDVKVYETAVADVLNHAIMKYNVSAVGVSTQMYSICADTENGRIVYQWNAPWKEDSETTETMWAQTKISGCPADTIFPAYKLLSRKRNRNADRTFLPFGIKEHLLQFLTGTLCTDYATASASGMLDIRNLRWNTEILSAAGFAPAQMPALMWHCDAAGVMNCDAVLRTQHDVIVAPALGDGPSASYACRDISPLCCNTGTSMAARVIASKEVPADERQSWRFVLDDASHVLGGITSNGCSVFSWARDKGILLDALAGTGGQCMFFPWINGERTPYWSSSLTAAFTGMTWSLRGADMSDAIYKSVAFTLCRMVDELKRYVPSEPVAVVAGGGVHIKPFWDAFLGSMRIKTMILDEGDFLAAMGAAASAAKAVGMEFRLTPEGGETFEPTGTYATEYSQWCVAADAMAKAQLEKK